MEIFGALLGNGFLCTQMRVAYRRDYIKLRNRQVI